ncbi:Fic family protein [Pseudomonas sp. NPDC090201]|uniref:Fic family protein n=1 Tax=Pseudomonas sp. NPDC090201 TaxID=3364475 RepID=UPI0037F7254F
MRHCAGYAWLAQTYEVAVCQPLKVRSKIGSMRKDSIVDGVLEQVFPAQYQPGPTLAEHLTFAFKREPIHLELLARLFSRIDPAELEQWIRAEPTGQYARRACFLYEWFGNPALAYPGVEKGNYVEFMDGERYLVSQAPQRNSRWRVIDNLPGTAHFCPLIRITQALAGLIDYDLNAELARLGVEFGHDTLLRSAVWLTIKESRSSFAIEHEEQQTDRIKRFAAVMEQRCGVGAPPLTQDQIAAIQQEILGPRALSYGIRQSPVFVGQTRGFQNVLHYLAPDWQEIEAILQGLQAFEINTQGSSSILRAAAISFGFVYIHPLSDGNGRISRFLINDILRRDKAVPAPYILPVSAVMQDHTLRPQNYDQVLDEFSRPLMQMIEPAVRFEGYVKYPDGMESNLHYDGFADTAPAWRYIDLTAHAQYLARVLRQTVEKEMRDEASILRNHQLLRDAIKNVFEGPDADIDRIIRSVHQSEGQVGNKLLKQYTLLEDAGIRAEIVALVAKFLG